MESTFDVFLTGELLPGFERGEAVSQLAAVFKLELGVADQLADGQRRQVKTGCNKAAALQLRQALTAAGLQVAVQRHGAAPAANPLDAVESYDESGEKAVFDAQPSSNDGSIGEIKPVEASIPVDYEPIAADALSMEKKPGKVEIVGELELAPPGELIIEPSAEVAAPVTELNFDLAPAGAPIPNLKRNVDNLDPNTDHLHLLSEDGD